MPSDMSIHIGADEASDSWGFVGVVSVGDAEAYRTLEAFTTPSDAVAAVQRLVADGLGELLAGREWRAVRDERGALPTRRDFSFSALRTRLVPDPAAAEGSGPQDPGPGRN